MTSIQKDTPALTEQTLEAMSLQRKRRVPIPYRLMVALAALIATGTLLLLLPGMTTHRITFMDALFTATSASSVTGLAVLTTSTAFTRPGQWVILFLMQFGGLGLIVIIVLTLRLLGRHISLMARLAVSSSLGLAGQKGRSRCPPFSKLSRVLCGLLCHPENWGDRRGPRFSSQPCRNGADLSGSGSHRNRPQCEAESVH